MAHSNKLHSAAEFNELLSERRARGTTGVAWDARISINYASKVFVVDRFPLMFFVVYCFLVNLCVCGKIRFPHKNKLHVSVYVRGLQLVVPTFYVIAIATACVYQLINWNQLIHIS